METYAVSILQEEDYTEYEAFVKSCPEALYEHSLEVKDLVAHHFKFKPFYLIARGSETKSIQGVLPLFEARSFIEGKRLVSVPFFPFGGVIGESVDCKRTLLRKAKELSSTAKFLQLRQRYGMPSELAEMEGFIRQAPILDFMIHLKKTELEMWGSLKRDVRRNIKRAAKNGLTFVKGNSKKELDDFYDIYLNTRKKRGVPAWPYGLFEEALKSHDSLIGLVYHDHQAIAGGFFSFYGKEIIYGFSGADYTKISLCPYHHLVWNISRYGIKKGYEIIDYGPTTREMNDGGLFDFKSRWCDEHRELPYYFYAKEKKNIPDFKRSLWVYKMYGVLWNKLPKSVIRLISPFIIRQFS